MESWILDTAYGKWLDVPLERVEVIVALDYPRWLSLSRLVRRTAGRVLDGRQICNGNRESLRNALSQNSMIVWHFTSFPRKRARIRQWSTARTGPEVIVFRTPGETERWLRNLPARGV
jgi:hypothetical protein